MIDKTRENGRTREGGMDLGERGARKTTHLIEATNVAHREARVRVKHMKTQRSGGIGSRGRHKSVVFVC